MWWTLETLSVKGMSYIGPGIFPEMTLPGHAATNKLDIPNSVKTIPRDQKKIAIYSIHE